jgi:anti-anti-sigma regulatory factor
VPTPLEISTQPGADGITVVTVAGEIDTSNAERFRDALGQAAAAADAAAADGAAADGAAADDAAADDAAADDAVAGADGADGGGSFVVDLTGVEYLDSAGVHALFGYAPRIRLIAGPLLEPVLTVSGLSGITSMRDDSPREPQ